MKIAAQAATAALLALLATSAGAADPTEERFYGFAFDRKTDRFLYTETNYHRYRGQDWLEGRIGYFDANGRELGRKKLTASSAPLIPLSQMELTARGGYAEGITAVYAYGVTLFRRNYGAKSAVETRMPREGLMTADYGFHTLLRRELDKLLAGQTVTFRFVAAGQLDWFRFRARRTGELQYAGVPSVHFILEPDSLLRLIVDPLEVTFDPKRGRTLEYRGVSSLHDPESGESYVVRATYAGKPPPDVKVLPPLP